MRIKMLAAAAGMAAVAMSAAACSSSSSSGSAGSGATLKTANINGVTVVTNAKGFTLYSFARTRPPRRSAPVRALRSGRR